MVVFFMPVEGVSLKVNVLFCVTSFIYFHHLKQNNLKRDLDVDIVPDGPVRADAPMFAHRIVAVQFCKIFVKFI